MKLAVFNGSPRGQRSNTKILLDAFLTGYGSEAPRQLYIYQESDEALKKAFIERDTIIIAFPLYTDSVPGRVKYFLELMGTEDWSGKRIGVIVQSGFPEAIHTSYIARYFEILAGKMNSNFSGAVIKGGLEGIRLQPPRLTAGLREDFRKLGSHFRDTGLIDQDIVDKLKTPWILSPGRRLVYRCMSILGIANLYWNYNLRINKAFKQRFARPYE